MWCRICNAAPHMAVMGLLDGPVYVVYIMMFT